MDKIVLFGMGKMYGRYLLELEKNFEIVAVSDNNMEVEGKNKLYVRPQNIINVESDYIVVCCMEYEEVRQQLLSFGIDNSKIKYVEKYLWEWEGKKYNLGSSLSKGTSVTDQYEYPALCQSIAENSNLFESFRQSVIYRDVVETVTESLGDKYLKIINNRERCCFDYDEWKRFQKNDYFGKPIVYEYFIKGKGISLSPTTVRYVKILQDILYMFDYKNIKKVAEIGIGYGGQARIIVEYLSVSEYYLIDLPSVIKLAGVYLSKFGDEGIFYLCDGTQPLEIREYDLFISNYAFSELIRPVQEMYMSSVVMHCKSGYILWNELSNNMYGGYSVEELLNIIPNAKALDEDPLTYAGNKLIVWGTIV